MPSTYPRSENPFIDLRHQRQFRRHVDCLHDLCKSMAGRLEVQTYLNVKGDEAGWHGSPSTNNQDHLTIKSEEQIITKKGEIKRKVVGHILPDGTTEDFGKPNPSLEWLKKDGKIPGTEAISYLEQLRKTGHEALIKDVRRQLKDRLSQNGVGPED